MPLLAGGSNAAPKAGPGTYQARFTKTGENDGTLTIGPEKWTVHQVFCD
jgi:hypothetical protein